MKWNEYLGNAFFFEIIIVTSIVITENSTKNGAFTRQSQLRISIAHKWKFHFFFAIMLKSCLWFLAWSDRWCFLEWKFRLFDPSGHGWIGGHYFHTWCPSVRQNSKIRSTSDTMRENNEHMLAGALWVILDSGFLNLDSLDSKFDLFGLRKKNRKQKSTRPISHTEWMFYCKTKIYSIAILLRTNAMWRKYILTIAYFAWPIWLIPALRIFTPF